MKAEEEYRRAMAKEEEYRRDLAAQHQALKDAEQRRTGLFNKNMFEFVVF